MSQLTVLFSEKPRIYTGVELRPHFLLTELGMKGTALGAFIGACDVKTEHLVDWEDRLVSDHIRAGKMVHLIGEFFGIPLREGVWIQRWMVAKLLEDLTARMCEAGSPAKLRRDGDDIFISHAGLAGLAGKDERKLTVSIVTASPVSILFHLGINVDPSGAPVPAIGLQELGIDASKWIGSFLENVKQEWNGIEWACAKVRPVV